jgi:hypothetical protein
LLPAQVAGFSLAMKGWDTKSKGKLVVHRERVVVASRKEREKVEESSSN